MQNDTLVAVDLAKSVFQVAVSHHPGQVSKNRRFSRTQFAEFLAQLPKATIVMEACGSAHFWARRMQALWLLGDAMRVQQALINFAGNAVKFTARGQIDIRVSVEEDHGDEVLLRFEVEDEGVGIEPKTLAQLFQPFVQADSSTSRKFGGTGLGLAITQHLAHHMGGTVGAKSVPGEGSVFWFTVRLLRCVPPGEAKSGAARLSQEEQLRRLYRGARVLVADDDPFNGEIARDLLESLGLVVEVVTDGAHAIAQVESASHAQAYDLIFMDVQMPHTDGLVATRAIRALPTVRQVPIVALTANAFVEDRRRALDSGMNDLLTKPIDPKSLYATLGKWLPGLE